MKTPHRNGTTLNIYKAVFEHSLQAIFIARPDGTILEANRTACDMFGYSQEEFRCRGRQGIIDETWGNFSEDLVTRATTGRCKGELMCIRKDGEFFPCEYTSVVSADENGCVCSVTMLVDISARKKQENEMVIALDEANAAKATYRNILESISDGYVTIDSNWCYTYINDKAAALMKKKSPEELLGKNIWTEFSEATGSRFYQAFQQVMTDRKPLNFEDYYEPWDAYFENRIYPADDGGIAIFFSDITPQRRILNRVKQSEYEMKMILDNTDELFMIADKDLRLVAVNKTYRKRLRDVLGKDLRKGDSILPIASPEYLDDLMKIFERVLKGERVRRKFIVRSEKKGEQVFDSNFIPIRSKGKPVEIFMVALTDVTEEEKMRKDLKASEEKYRQLFYSNPVPFWITDIENGRFLDVNDAAIKHYGYTREEFLEMTLFDIRPPEDIMAFKQVQRQVEFRERSLIFRGQPRHRKKNGEIIDVEITAYGLSHNGKKAALISAADITENKRAEQQLRNNETRLRSLVEKGSEIIALTDVEANILYMSPTIKIILGYDADERVGKKPFEHVHAEDLPKIHAAMKQLIAVPNSCAKIHWRHLHANGTWRWMEGVSTNLLSDPAVQGIVHNFRDITQQKLTEDALRAHNERFRLVAKATQDSIWDWDLETNLVTRDGKRLETLYGYKGWEPEEVDLNWGRLAHPEDWQRVTLQRNALLADPAKNYWQDEYRFLRTDGRYAYVQDCGYILRDESGKAVRIIGASHDITERKKHEEALKEKNGELKRLSAYLQRVREEERKHIAREVHDELGQLASALKIDIDWLNLRLSADEELARKRVEHAGKTIEVLITSVRKIASSLRPSVLDDIGLNAALKWHCTEFQNLNGVQCMFDSGFDDSDMPMQVKTELFRMTQESLTNVMRHAKASSVSVMTKEDECNYYLTITDNGIGFDRRQQKNTLGLVGLRERAVSLNGKLEIESAPGRGTVISVTIPKEAK